jgi:DNA-binding transcriptional MerR regulator
MTETGGPALEDDLSELGPDLIIEGRAKAKKAPGAFRTISEVADELQVPQHVLRFWETKFPQVKPLKRGGGRRYYRPDDITLLRRISGLLYDHGYTIKGVQRLLRESGGRLSDDIPPPDPNETSADEPSEMLDSADPEPEEAQLLMPGLAPIIRPQAEAPPRLPRQPRPSSAEADRLRAVLRVALQELEDLRALLA